MDLGGGVRTLDSTPHHAACLCQARCASGAGRSGEPCCLSPTCTDFQFIMTCTPCLLPYLPHQISVVIAISLTVMLVISINCGSPRVLSAVWILGLHLYPTADQGSHNSILIWLTAVLKPGNPVLKYQLRTNHTTSMGFNASSPIKWGRTFLSIPRYILSYNLHAAKSTNLNWLV